MQQYDGALRLHLLQALYDVHHICCFHAFEVVEVVVTRCIVEPVGVWLLTKLVAYSIGCLVYVRAECGKGWREGVLGVSHLPGNKNAEAKRGNKNQTMGVKTHHRLRPRTFFFTLAP